MKVSTAVLIAATAFALDSGLRRGNGSSVAVKIVADPGKRLGHFGNTDCMEMNKEAWREEIFSHDEQNND
jgi:hypothetical protein